MQGLALFPGQDTMWHFVPILNYVESVPLSLHIIQHLSDVYVCLLQCHKAMCNGSNTTEWNGNGMEEYNGMPKNLYSCVLCVGSIRPSAYRILRMLLIHLWFIRLFLPLHFTHIIQLSLSLSVCVCVVLL